MGFFVFLLIIAQIYFYYEQRKAKEKSERLELELWKLHKELWQLKQEQLPSGKQGSNSPNEQPKPIASQKPIAPLEPVPPQVPVSPFPQPAFPPPQPSVETEPVPVKGTTKQASESPVSTNMGESNTVSPVIPPATPEPQKRVLLPKWWEEEWEMLVGGKLLNRIGAIALILGIGFFLKYAFDHDWISEPIRLVIGMMVGGLMLWLGAYTRKKGLPVFAQGAVGVGIAVMYLTVYAADNFYGLVSPVVAVIWMSGVTLLAFQQAISYNSLATSWIAWFGGAWTPFLFSAEPTTPLGFYLYFTLFTATVLAILWKKPSWISIYIAHAPVSYIAYLVVGIQFEDAFAYKAIALVVLLALFMIFEYQKQKDAGKWLIGYSYLHPIVVFVISMIFISVADGSLEKRTQFALGAFLVGFLFTIPMLYGKWQKSYTEIPSHRRVVFQVTFFLLFVVATAIRWSDSTLATLLGLESLAIAIWGLRYSRMHGWYFSIGLWFLSFLVAFEPYFPFVGDKKWLFFDLHFLPIAILIGSALLIIRLGKDRYSQYLEGIHIAWIFMATIGLVLEWFTLSTSPSVTSGPFSWLTYLHSIDHYLILSVILILLGVGMYRFGIRKEYRHLQSFLEIGIALILVCVLIVSPLDTTLGFTDVVFNVRTLCFVLLGLLLFWLGRSIPKNSASKNHILIQKLAPFMIVLLAFEWVTVEVMQFFDTVSSYPEGMMGYSLVIAWAILSFVVMQIVRDLQIWSSRLSQGILFLSVFTLALVTLTSETLFPVLNVRTFCFVLLGFLLFWFGKSIPKDSTSKYYKLIQKLAPLTIVLLAFEWVTVEVMHYFGTDRFTSEDILGFILVFAWGLLSFIVTWIVKEKQLWTSRLSQGILALSVLVLAVVSLKSDSLSPVLNMRFLSFLWIVGILAFQLKMRAKLAEKGFSKVEQYVYASVIVLLLLEMVSVEVWTSSYSFPSLQQLALSITWLLFAVVLLTVGIWKKWKKIRLAALAILGVTICKIFLFDLSFLDTIYRIISFIVLGVILLATSYVYQRNKHWFKG